EGFRGVRADPPDRAAGGSPGRPAPDRLPYLSRQSLLLSARGGVIPAREGDFGCRLHKLSEGKAGRVTGTRQHPVEGRRTPDRPVLDWEVGLMKAVRGRGRPV